jgi:hypothetical protein
VDDVVGSVQEDITGLRDSIPDDFSQAVQNAVLAAFEGTVVRGLIDDPTGTIETRLNEYLEANVSDELDQEVQDLLDETDDLGEDN